MRARRTLVVAALLVAAHAGLLRVAVEWSFVAALLSPGTHSGLAALLFALTFLAARLLVYVALPAVLAAVAVFHGVSWASRYFSRGQTSPSRRPGPMLSAPVRGSEVADGEAR